MYSLKLEDVKKKLELSQKLTLISFELEWYGVCHIMSIILSKIEKKYKNDLQIFRLDLEENREFAKSFNIFDTPEIILYREGEIIDRIVGIMSKRDLEIRLKYFINRLSQQASS